MSVRTGMTLSACCVAAMLAAQGTARTVADGVYTDAQAIRGAAAFDMACSGCHRADLAGGANGPPLRGDRFATDFADEDLKKLYTRIATTMPRGAPASLEETMYLDIVAHVLRENGFPAGGTELTPDVLGEVKVLPGRPKPAPPVGDFSYVSVVGCLIAGPENTWLLSSASAPAAVALSDVPAPRGGGDAAGRPLGTEVFRLLDAMAYNPESHKGQKVHVRGLLIKLSTEQRMTISSLETIAPACHD